jgi:predicted amidohydrolase
VAASAAELLFRTSRNLEKELNHCREAKSMGANLAVFPELWNTGATRQAQKRAGDEPRDAPGLKVQPNVANAASFPARPRRNQVHRAAAPTA